MASECPLKAFGLFLGVFTYPETPRPVYGNAGRKGDLILGFRQKGY
jgi:hypothetical protein